jgi:hypothetical protein
MTMTKKQAEQYHRLVNRLTDLGLTTVDIDVLLKAERTLQRWFELECGDGNNYASWAIERDEETEIPYMVRHIYSHGNGKDQTIKTKIADREAGARKRIAKICEAAKLSYYIQGDPRGCALYVSNEPLKDNDYTRGIAVCL